MLVEKAFQNRNTGNQLRGGEKVHLKINFELLNIFLIEFLLRDKTIYIFKQTNSPGLRTTLMASVVKG